MCWVDSLWMPVVIGEVCVRGPEASTHSPRRHFSPSRTLHTDDTRLSQTPRLAPVPASRLTGRGSFGSYGPDSSASDSRQSSSPRQQVDFLESQSWVASMN